MRRLFHEHKWVGLRGGSSPSQSGDQSFRDEWKRMEWPKRQTPLGKEPRTFLRKDEALIEAIEAMTESIERRQASCGECS
jgi:hypothetical protein